MPSIPGTIVAAKITTGNTANTFPVADQSEIKGGFQIVDTLVARDAISSERREIGMPCWVISESKLYQLEGGITNSDWVEAKFAGSSPIFVEDTVTKDGEYGDGSKTYYVTYDQDYLTIRLRMRDTPLQLNIGPATGSAKKSVSVRILADGDNTDLSYTGVSKVQIANWGQLSWLNGNPITGGTYGLIDVTYGSVAVISATNFEFGSVAGFPEWVGVVSTSSPPVENFVKYGYGATDPDSTFDSTQGWDIGSIWFNEDSGTEYFFMCVDASWGAAVWNKIYTSSVKDNFSAVTNPGVTNDSSEGYLVGSTWINTNTGEAFVCTDPAVGAAVWFQFLSAESVGTGVAVYKGVTDGKMQFKSLTGSGAVSVTTSGDDEIQISASFTDPTTASNAGTGEGLIFYQKSGDDLQFKSIKAGSNITVTNNTQDVTIAAAAGADMLEIEVLS